MIHLIFCEKTPAQLWEGINRNFDFWWFGIAFRQTFIGVMIRTRKSSDS